MEIRLRFPQARFPVFKKITGPWLVETNQAWFARLDVEIENHKKNMKLKSKIISRNSFKSDQINCMHIHHKCSLSMTIHSPIGNSPKLSTFRNSQFAENSIIQEIDSSFISPNQKVDWSKKRVTKNSIHRKIDSPKIWSNRNLKIF